MLFITQPWFVQVIISVRKLDEVKKGQIEPHFSIIVTVYAENANTLSCQVRLNDVIPDYI